MTDSTEREGLRENDAVWAMFYRDGKSIGEIAAHFGVSIYDLSPWLYAPLTNASRRPTEAAKGDG